MMKDVRNDYESPASEVVEIDAEQCFAGSSDWPGTVGEGDGVGSGNDWPDFQ